eukprot:scaffold266427_cov25-Tisochrysis_lutea.AAC.3
MALRSAKKCGLAWRACSSRDNFPTGTGRSSGKGAVAAASSRQAVRTESAMKGRGGRRSQRRRSATESAAAWRGSKLRGRSGMPANDESDCRYSGLTHPAAELGVIAFAMRYRYLDSPAVGRSPTCEAVGTYIGRGAAASPSPRSATIAKVSASNCTSCATCATAEAASVAAVAVGSPRRSRGRKLRPLSSGVPPPALIPPPPAPPTPSDAPFRPATSSGGAWR